MSRSTPPPRILSIGSGTYDLFVRTGAGLLCSKDGNIQLPEGAKIRVDSVTETCGGGAANTSVGLARLGCHASFCGIVGDDQWGERILKNLAAEGVDTASATVVENETSSFSIILNTDCGERVILYSQSANAHLHDVTFDKETAASRDWIYFNHIHEDSCVIQDDIVEILGKHAHLGMTWNPGGRHLKRGMADPQNAALLRCTRLLLLNKEEALLFTGDTSVETALRTLRAAGAGIVCITDGPHGCTATDGVSVVHCPTIPHAPIVDTTGAGDAFGIGATWALLQGLDLPKTLRAGTINATSVLAVTGAQAGLLTDIDMHTRLETVALDVDIHTL
jgi:sugar/nucleoside kinase (ribokinase family)